MPKGNNWWLNRAGHFAKYTNPGGGPPAYGVSMDVATAPFADPTQFESLSADEQDAINAQVLKLVDDYGFGDPKSDENKAALKKLKELRPQSTVSTDDLMEAYNRGQENYAKWQQEQGGNWLTDSLSTIGDFSGWVDDHVIPDQLKTVVTGKYSPIWGEYASPGRWAAEAALHGRIPFTTRDTFGLADASQKFSEGVATFQVAGGVAERDANSWTDQWANLFHGSTWSEAHNIVTRNHLTMGDAMMGAVHDSVMRKGPGDNSLLTDGQRLRKWLDSSGWRTLGSLGAEVALSWSADPTVLLGRGLGAGFAFRRGDILGDGYARALQRDVIGSETREEALSKVMQQRNVTDRLYARRGLTLWDRLEGIRAQSLETPTGEFLAQKTFQNNVNGVVMGALIKEATDEEWPVLKRFILGDDKAKVEMGRMRGEMKSKIDAFNEYQLAPAEKEVDALLAQKSEMEAQAYFLQMTGAEQAEAGRRLMSSADTDFVNEPLAAAQARVEAIKAQLSTFETHDNWYNNVLAGAGAKAGENVSAGGQPNVVFHGLESISKPGSMRTGDRIMNSPFMRADRDKGRKWRDDNPTTHVWQHDWLSPTSYVHIIPRSWFQNNNLLVNYHEKNGALDSINRYFDEYESLTGTSDMARRSAALEEYAGLMTEKGPNSREEFVLALQDELARGVAKKYGLSDDMMKVLMSEIVRKHQRGWRRLTTGHFTSVEMPTGDLASMFEWATDNGLHRVHLPMSTAELVNSHRLLNLRDLDYAIRRHKDILQEMSKSQDYWTRLHGSAIATRRNAADIAFAVMEGVNHIWKPLVLFSLRWPLRVMGDENTRWLLLGAKGLAQEAASGAANVAYNTAVRAMQQGAKYERWRVARSGMLTEDTSAPRVVDALDPKMANGGQMPFEVRDFDGDDVVRLDTLSQKLAERDAEFADQVVARARGEKPTRGRWAQRFEDRVKAADKTKGGFIVDPVSERGHMKGWATSVFPGRMRTFVEKPNSDDYRLFAGNNTDVLQNKKNKIGVWYDSDLDRWVVDVIRHHAKRDSALAEAAAAQVDHVFDVSNGFQRMVWEDDPLGNWRGAFPSSSPFKMEKGAAGTGTVKVRSLDGVRREETHIFGPDRTNGNIFVEGVKADNAVEGYFGGGTRMHENMRSANMMGDYQAVEPAVGASPESVATQPGEKLWADKTAYYANMIVRKDASFRRMLQGQTDRQILGWMKSADGRIYRQRMGIGAMRSPEEFIARQRQIFETQFPGRAIQERMRESNITPREAMDLIPDDQKAPIHGESIKALAGENPALRQWNNFVQKMYHLLGSKFSNKVTRHPMGAAMYKMKLRNLVAEYDDKQLTNEVMMGLQAQARSWSMNQVRKYMFNMQEDFNGIRAFRFLAPFFQAQVEVIDRYAKLIAQHPESLARLIGLARITGGDQGPLWHTVSSFETGMEPTDNWDRNGFAVTQLPMDLLSEVPYFKKLTKAYKDVPIPTSSINLILQGEQPWLPSFGPIVTIPVSEVIRHANLEPKVMGQAWFKALFPYGMPKGALDGFMPAWMKRVGTMIQQGDDATFATEQYQVLAGLRYDWKKGGKVGPEPTLGDAKHYVELMYGVRAFAGLTSPVQIAPDTKYQFFIDKYRDLVEEDPSTAKQKFYDEYGPDLFLVAASTSKTNMDLPPTELASKMYDEHKGLMQDNPLLAAVIAGPGASRDAFSFTAYQWQLGTSVAPGSSTDIREKLSPEEIEANALVDRGWIEYNRLMAAIDVELQRRGLVTEQSIAAKAKEMTGTTDPDAMEAAKESLLDAALQTDYASDLRNWKTQEMHGISKRNPGWEDAYNSRSTEMGEWIRQAQNVVQDPSLDQRPDIQGLRRYLNERKNYVTELLRRQALGGSGTLTADSNIDLAQGWYTFTRHLINTNLLFGEIWHRYLEDDDLTSAR